MSTTPESILVLGAGELGTAVLVNLAKHAKRSATTITVLLRQTTIETKGVPKRKELDELKTVGVQFLAGDINNDSTEELSAKFAKFDMVIGCSGMYNPPGTQVRLTEAVLNARVPRYIPWQFGVDYDIIGRNSSQDLFTEQMRVRDLLRGQTTTRWVIVSTGMFMSFLFEDSFGVVSADRKTVRALGGWDNAVTVTDVQDIGRMVAEIALINTNIGPEVIYTAGDTISYGRLADVVSDIEGKDVNKELWSVEKLKDDLSQDPQNGLKKYRIVFAEGRGVSWDMQQTLNQKHSIHLQTVREWLANNRS